MTPPLPEALKNLDYTQLILHGKYGCFHIAKDGICGRADLWAGHPGSHNFVSLHDAVAEYGKACRAAAIEEAAKRAEAYAYMSANFNALAEEFRSME